MVSIVAVKIRIVVERLLVALVRLVMGVVDGSGGGGGVSVA